MFMSEKRVAEIALALHKGTNNADDAIQVQVNEWRRLGTMAYAGRLYDAAAALGISETEMRQFYNAISKKM